MKSFSDIRMDIRKTLEKMQGNGKLIIIAGISIILLMILTCIIVFFLTIRGSEQVMVPNVTGKELSTALLELQAKELYPKVQLRFSDHPDDKGVILEQSPTAGAIVKAGRRINLVISRGVVIDRVEDYSGQNIDEVKMHLQSLFTSTSRPLIVLTEPPLYEFNTAPAGTVLQQNPAPDTQIINPIKLELVVSRGPESQKVTVPNLIDLSLNDFLKEMSTGKVIYNLSSRAPQAGEIAGRVVSQMPAADSVLNEYSRVSAVIALDPQVQDGLTYGIYSQTLPQYPYPIQLKLEALTPSGERYSIVTFDHPGGALTIPYAVPENTVLILSILNTEVSRKTITVQ